MVHANDVVGLIEKVAGTYSFNSIAGFFQPEDKPSQDEDVKKIVLSLRERGLTVKPVVSVREGSKRELR
ncbi:hypothetical protein KBC75_01735 [Candidatus Shapirobacteria bacterium]|nr:hypothetical protein [Candidatus Shapirobacteria bacterium]